ncbi:MAG: adenosylcobinamide-GDP ribazoletransferase [Mariprofundales bacterium]|nr:adenosylcobinamide-GDP ribazoletransferase [Mariprofundales bacterium]
MSTGCCSAFSLLMRDPVSGESHDFAVSRDWFPVIGLTVGLLIMVVGKVGGGVDPWLGAVLALLAWYGVSGGAHVVAASAMAEGCAGSPAAGSLQTTLLVAVKMVLLMLLISGHQWWALVLIPAWSRLGAAWWVAAIPPAADDTMAQSLYDNAQQEGNATGFWALALWLLGGALSPLMWLAPLVIAAWYWLLRNRLGGMRGAAIHAGIEWCEVALLILSVALLGLVS